MCCEIMSVGQHLAETAGLYNIKVQTNFSANRFTVIIIYAPYYIMYIYCILLLYYYRYMRSAYYYLLLMNVVIYVYIRY